MNKYADLQPNEIVWQIFVGPNGLPHVFKMSVVSSDENALKVVPLGDAGELTGKIVTYDDEEGIPRTYRSKDIDRMFAEYLFNIQGWNRAKLFAVSPKDFAEEIETLTKILEMWKQTRRRVAASKPRTTTDKTAPEE